MSTRIDWKNHLIGFIATIIGIIIGLNLDEWQSERETQRRLNDFNKLINSEIQKNIATLDTLLEDSYKYESGLRFLVDKDINDNIIHCTQEELDSVIKVRRSSPFIFNFDKIDKDKFRIYYALNLFRFDYQNTVWESFKNTDLINNMEPEEITKVSRIYLSLVKKSEEINDLFERMKELIDTRRTDKALSTMSIKEYLLRLINVTHSQSRSVDEYLLQLKDETGGKHKLKFVQPNLKNLKDGFR